LIAVLVILVECPHCGGDFDEGDGKGSLQRHMAAVKAIETREKGPSSDDNESTSTVMSDSEINEKIIKKIEKLTKDKNQRIFCKRILRQELLYRKDKQHNFRGQLKTWIQDLFPYEATKGD
jgi:hypothetical protein